MPTCAKLAKSLMGFVPSLTTLTVCGMRCPKSRHSEKNSEEIRLIPKLLAEIGVRLVIVEHLTGTRVDGATLWLEDGSPVIVLSLRYDRIDSFWHILNNDGEIVDSNLVGKDAAFSDEKPAIENKADEFAVAFLVPQDELRTFVNNHSPLYYARDIQGFAQVHQAHPGIVVGQLHHVGELKYYQFREFPDKVRQVITDSALTDGWDVVISGVQARAERSR